jgi:hypothetical protein
MTPRRPRNTCPHGDVGRPYPVVSTPGWPLGKDTEFDEALERLEQALTACEGVFTASIEQLTADDVMKALKSVPLPHRGAVFKPLGLNMKPRQITRQMSQDTRALLVRGNEHDVRHAVSALTMKVATDVEHAALGESEVDPAATWGGPLCRVATWSSHLTSVKDSRVWLWASQQSWFVPEGLINVELDIIAGAARRVVDASTDFDGDRALEPAASAAVDKQELQEKNGADLRAELDSLESALKDAVKAAQRITGSMDEGHPPAYDDVVILMHIRQSFDALVSSLNAKGVPAPGDSIEALRTAVDEVSAGELDGETRSLLERVCNLTAPSDQPLLVSQLAQAQDEARDLLGRSPWDSLLRQQAESLGLLADLVAPETQVASPMELAMRWSQARPNLSFLALQATHLIVVRSAQLAEPTESTPAPVVPSPSDSMPPPRPEQGEAGASHVVLVPDEEAPVEVLVVEDDAQESDGDQTEPSSEQLVVEGVARLIGAERFGLAAVIGVTAGWSDVLPTALRVAALATALRYPNGGISAALRDELVKIEPAEMGDDTPSTLLVVPALIRIALVTGEPTTGALLTELANRLEPNLAEVAEQVGRRALHGVLIDSGALLALADVAEGERRLSELAEAASQARGRHRTLRFKRATDISKVWLSGKGILGKPLSIVERNETGLVDEVAAAIAHLADGVNVKEEIDLLDRRFQGTSGKPIEGAGRRDLVGLVREVLTPLAEWVSAVQTLTGRDGKSAWSTGEVADMRASVLRKGDALFVALNDLEGNNDPLTAAAAKAAAASLRSTFDVLEGVRTLSPAELAPAYVLSAELAKLSGVALDDSLEQFMPPPDTTLPDLLDAVDRSWDEAVALHIDGGNFDVARFLLHKASVGQLPAGNLTDSDLRAGAADTAERAARAALEHELDQFGAVLGRARSDAEISEEQHGELTSLLEGARKRAKGHDLAQVRRMCEDLERLLRDYRAEARARLDVRLEALKQEDRVESGTSDRITTLMESGQLSTAEELIYYLEIDEKTPDISESDDLERFVPAVPDALVRGVTAELIACVRSRTVLHACRDLDFTQLSKTQAELAADTLNSWLEMSEAEPAQRNNFGERAQLLPVLRMIGLETGSVTKLPDWPRGRDRRFVEVAVTGQVGQAIVPAFGSKLGGRLRVLLAWGQPSAELLMSWADGDTSDESLLIAHFGTMNMQTRRDLAVLSVGRTAPIVVLDDAALAYLAAHGNGQMTAAMNVLLPFSGVNPYLQKRGTVSPEMFYGREEERRSVLDPEGTQLVFGGRGLGKSALLHSAAEYFEKQRKATGEHVAIYLDLKVVGIRADSAKDQNAIWDALLDKLRLRGVVPALRRNGPRKASRGWVEQGIREWLKVDRQRRLLVLLDEADQFFEADMPHFNETAALKSLGQDNGGRVKVVFAGLHSVQRYAKKARNAPFSHMAQRPTVIGPLKPQHAANLLSRPLAALGFEFEHQDLVNRILGSCSYQPFLLQIFANRLIAVMHARRRDGVLGVDQPPYIIVRQDVDAVVSQADLRADIGTAFRDTLNLDHRYGVIAHVLAHQAHEYGLDARLTDKQLRQECQDYWPEGFGKLDVEGFRAYLQEMTGLGVLAPNNDGRGWHLRSANVLGMIGTKADVEAELVSAAELSVPGEFLLLESRQELPSGNTSPLTAAQVDDVLGDHNNQVRVVLGSRATGVDLVNEAIEIAASVGDRFQLPRIGGRRRDFKEQLVAGRPGEWRVVLDDLYNVAPNEGACLEALEYAQTLRPLEAGVTRSAVIIAGPKQIPLWRKVFEQEKSGSDSQRQAVGVVVLRRYTAATLRVWSMDTNMFTDKDTRARLLHTTGGWPVLVDRVQQLVKGGGEPASKPGTDEHEALRLVERDLGTVSGRNKLLSAAGLTDDERLSRAFGGILSIGVSERFSRGDLDVAAGFAVDEPEMEVECLIALQAFNVEDGLYTPESTLVRCWPE